MTVEETQTFARLVGGIEAKVEAFQSNWLDQDRRAAEGRRYLYDKMETIGKSVGDLTHEVRGVMQDVAEMKPAVTDWVAAKNQAMGAKTAASILGKGVYLLAGGAVALAGWAISHFSAAVLH